MQLGYNKKARQQLIQLTKNAEYRGVANLNLAKLALENNQLIKAKEYLFTVLQDKKYSNTARFILGRIAESQNKLEAAVKWYSQIDSGEFLYPAYKRAAELLAKEGKIQQARTMIRTIPITSIDDYKSLSLMEAELLFNVKELNASFEVLNQALEMMPNDIELLFAHSIIAGKINRIDILERDLKKILMQRPQHISALNTLGYTLADRTKRYDEALMYINQALKLSPNNPAILDSMGWVQYRLGNLKSAIEYLQRAFKLDQNDPEIAAHLGIVLWAQGEGAQAHKIWQDALKKNPDHQQLKKLIQQYPLNSQE